MFVDEQGPFISRAPLPTIGETQEVKSSNEVSLDTLLAFVCHEQLFILLSSAALNLAMQVLRLVWTLRR